MSLHDKMAQKAISMGESAQDFTVAAQQHAKASVLDLIIGGIVWYILGWKWALIPFGLALYAGFQSVSSTLIATRLEKLEKNSETPENKFIKIINAYSKVRETLTPGMVADATKLPYPKQQIKDVLIAGARSINDFQKKEIFKSAYCELANWQENVGDNNIGLDPSKINLNQDAKSLAKQVLEESKGTEYWTEIVEKERTVLKQEWESINP